jgi:hypothetical protein
MFGEIIDDELKSFGAGHSAKKQKSRVEVPAGIF